ncbi:transglutaminase [Alcanivorax hongdengensis A-11-3]|uniref:Transglutaminase n=1 Tax=Alcanivorax hongdengensis A-11-3 TaxID=1177179 RepID=L0WFE0_9GAMM|nr:DUF3488 and transglutaminase-like domain-containing protein [Alcanivorax hongdengensis]EKF74872.1 transglutaminase [Alcanivorax hongdengensis A-11-3]
MARIYQLPTHTRLWLTLAMLLCSLPQLFRGPLWQSGLLVLVVVIRMLVDRQRIGLPGRTARTALLLITVALTFYSFGRLYGPDAGVALLVSLFALKYLEVVKLRDAYVLMVLGYFVCATSLLFYQGILMFFYVLACITLLTACLVGINHSDTSARAPQHLRTAAVMLMQAVPLMVVLFILVPRVAPLWNMQIGSGQVKTGMSDTLSPGEVSSLSRSSEVAFRVAFEGDVPPMAQRYWRGLTLSTFDGRTWRQGLPAGMSAQDYLVGANQTPPHWFSVLKKAALQDALHYQYRVVMEPSHRRWLYAMAVPFVTDPDLRMARDFRLVADSQVDQRLGYQVTSVPSATGAMTLTPQERQLMLTLPASVGPRARSLAMQWRRDADSDSVVVQTALHYFHNEPFYYTLNPPRLEQDSIDDFLFRSRRGFCEHFASSFTFLMRAAGIPARVVAGYQGGQLNPVDGHLVVRQYDAHAWSEVWLDGRGWVRVDPTAAVAPQRIESGLQAALDAQGNTASNLGLDFSGFSGASWFGQIKIWMDYVDFRWQTWVLDYDTGRQLAFLSRIFVSVTPMKIALALLVCLGLPLLLILGWMLWRRERHPLSQEEKEFNRLFRLVERRGLTLAPGTTPRQLAEAISDRWPKAATQALHWRQRYERLMYSALPGDKKKQLYHLRRLRNRLYKLLY